MKLISWNVRGLGNLRAKRKLRRVLRQQSPNICFLSETKVNKTRMEKIHKRYGFHNGLEENPIGTKGGICLFWKDDIKVELVSKSYWHFDVLVEDRDSMDRWYLSGFYGNPVEARRNDSWRLLQHIKSKHTLQLPWIVMGDFNEILWTFEKKGGRIRNERQMLAFREALDVCELEDLGYSGSWFTWERGKFAHTNIRERLDRMVATSDWWDLFPDTKVSHLPFYHSDHRPIVLNTVGNRPCDQDLEGHLQFRFEATWVTEESCEAEVDRLWAEGDGSVPEKLEQLGRGLQRWSQQLSHDKRARQEYLQRELERLDALQPTDDVLLDSIQHKLELNLEIDRQEIKWEQRAHSTWLKEGDRNTSFYNKIATMRKRKKKVTGIEDASGCWKEKTSEVATVAADYFSTLYSSQGEVDCGPVLCGVRNKLPPEMNDRLTSVYTTDEIWEAVRGMDPLKASGFDGFPALFYQRYWGIVGPEVASYCISVLNRDISLTGKNHTNIILLPKVENPRLVAQYRPISLCSVLFKIISKVIANRLCSVLNVVIDEAQSGFVPGRLISDNIFVAYELIHSLKGKRKAKVGKFALKLDMSKAYDRVEWYFIEAMLKEKGFDTGWIDLVMECIRTLSYSVVLNGRSYSHIVPTRGLRQGDPLSPYLFLICSEGFSTLLQMAKDNGQLRGFKASGSGPPVTHLFFADDSLLFGDATEQGARCIRDILSDYSKFTGQVINLDKSVIFFSPSTSTAAANEVLSILGVRRVYDLDKYLGLPSMLGRNKKKSLQVYKDRINEKIASWSTRFLSQGGREVFIRSVLQSLPTYAMSCFLFPKTLCLEINRIFNKFWWKQNVKERGIYWCDWSKLSIPKEYGGLGFRDMLGFNVALLARQGWRMLMFPDSLFSRVLKAKYFQNTSFLEAQLGTNPSYTWRSVWSARGLLEKGLCWRVGTGSNIHIWSDRWIPSANSCRIESTPVQPLLHMVSDLIRSDGGAWNTELIEANFSREDANRILQIPLSGSPLPDTIFWQPCNTGTYSTKSGYRLLSLAPYRDEITNVVEPPQFVFYKKLWSLNLPPKVKCFMWRISWNYLPTKQNLHIKHIANNSLCPRCGVAIESLSHAFLQCEKIQAVWDRLGIQWPTISSNIEFIEFLESISATDLNLSLQFRYIAIWAVWSHRNRWHFEQIHDSVDELARFIMIYSQEWQGSLASSNVLRVVPVLHTWQPPAEGQLKLNFDAAFSSNTQTAGVGCLIRSHSGVCKAGFQTYAAHISDSCTAEALACREGLRFAKDHDFEHLIVEGDCLNVIKRLKSSAPDPSPSGCILLDAKKLLSELHITIINHIKREANIVADVIAKKGLRDLSTMHWFEEPPDFLLVRWPELQ